MTKGKLKEETKEKGIAFYRTKIKLLYEQQQRDGYINISEIARQSQVDPKTVRKWIKRQGIDDKKPEIKRTSKFSEDMKKDVLELIQNKNTIRDNASTRKIAVKISSKYNLSHKEQGRLSKPISHTTIRRFIKKVGLYPYKIRKVIGMLPIHRKKRLEFIKQIKERGITGKNIMFTDEKIFTLRNAPNIQNERVYVDPKDRKNLSNGEGDMTLLQRTKERHESQVMVSGGISYFGVTRLIFIIGSVEQISYMNILDHLHKDLDMLSSQGKELVYFQQDGASCHKAKLTMEKIKALFGDKELPVSWPPKSPDLSPIELLWSIITAELYKKEYNNIDEMKFALEDLWNRIPVKLCQDLMANFDRRIDLVEKYHGLRYADCWHNKEKEELDQDPEIRKAERAKKTAEEKIDEETPLNWKVHWNPYHNDDKNQGILQRIVVNPKVGAKWKNKEEDRLLKKIDQIKKKYDKEDKAYKEFVREIEERRGTRSDELSHLIMAQRESNENKRKAMLKNVIVLKKKMKNLQDKIRILKKSTALEYLDRASVSNLVGKVATSKGKKGKNLAIFKGKVKQDSNIAEEDQSFKEDSESTNS